MQDPLALPALIVAIIGLVVAVVGALTGIGSLAWQIITRRRGAHNVRLEISTALIANFDGTVSDWQVCFAPTNIGAAPVEVSGWGLEMPKKRGTLVQTRQVAASATLPHLLGPGTSINLFWPQDHVRLALTTHAADLNASDLRAFVRLGTGEIVYSRKRGVPV
jgi:hypothetical protein